MGDAPLTVEVYDSASPDEPVTVLSANFDPRRHVRWENRPGASAWAGAPPAPVERLEPDDGDDTSDDEE